MYYYPLSEESVRDYVRQSALMGTLFERGDSLVSRDLADGNVNLVFRVASTSQTRSAIVKQALPYARAVGEQFPMPLDRAERECRVLEFESRCCPELVPRVYHFDLTMCLTVLEDLNQHIILRRGLNEQKVYPRIGHDLGRFLARTLFLSSDLSLDSAAKKQLVKEFTNPALCKVTEDLVFTHPFMNHPGNRWNPALKADVQQIWADEHLLGEVLHLKHVFMTHAESLIHGDLHTGSIMVSAQETKVIDPEFAFVGPMAFDIGSLLANLAMSYTVQDKNRDIHGGTVFYGDWLLLVMRETWETFAQQFLGLWAETGGELGVPELYQEAYLRRILREATGFGGVEMIRRVIGLAHVAELEDIVDAQERTVRERTVLTIGRSWIFRQHEMDTMDDLLQMTTEIVTSQQKG